LDVDSIKKVIDAYRDQFGSDLELKLPEAAQAAFTAFERSAEFISVASNELTLMEYSALENVLDKLNACKMDSNHIRDRLLRVLKRGELEYAVQKCGAEIRRSLEALKVSVYVA
jgi:hypothetical protein